MADSRTIWLRMRDADNFETGRSRSVPATAVAKVTVTAVVVSYNRLKLLKQALDALLNQTVLPDLIIVVDNHSSDGTGEWLAKLAQSEERVRTVSLSENLGASGGFNHGIRAAYESGSDWIWTMDDDTIPAPDALEQFVACIEPLSEDTLSRMGYLTSKVVWKDGSRHVHNVPLPTRFWWDGYEVIPGSIQLQAATFVSLLINRMAIRAVGFPVKEFFFWWDDVEFTLRMSDGGFLGYHVDQSRVIHATPANRASEYRFVDAANLWKYKYGIRNEVAVVKGRRFGRITAFWRIIKRMVEMSVNRVPVRFMGPLFFWGLRGYFFDYRRYITRPN
jgi:rhamnopyranosyl-N-acetylglucosaminyl-diphospho-decaprenol beta-1,3/1,4-galactofuranosyltransferase